jgi:hypothetical protein
MISEKKIAKFLIKYIYNPTTVFFAYFLLISLYGLSKKEAVEIYFFLSPYLIVLFTFLYLPFLYLLFNVANMKKMVKINHVLEHGTIYFLKEKYGKKHRIGGSSSEDGFRIYGQKESKEDIIESFNKVKHYLEEGKSLAVLSKRCGSSIHILGGVSFITLTITFLILLFFELQLFTIKMLLTANVVLFFLLRHPIGKYFQKKYVMCFEFSEPRIIAVSKVRKKGFFEKNPVYFIKTDFKLSNANNIENGKEKK